VAAEARSQGLDRSCPPVRDRAGVLYSLEGRRVIGFCSNDYLGLAAHQPAPARASGATASRLVCGDSEDHRALERRLARLVELDDAVLFASGYQLNVGVLPALLSPGDLVFSDAHNHASLIDGLRLAENARTILPHLAAPPASQRDDRLAFWVVESVFSMDGDGPSSESLRAHAEHGVLYLDEAHALGLHEGGAGRARSEGIRPTILVGTLGKALGCAGAFVAGSETLCAHLRAHARSFVFTTGISPALVPTIFEHVDLVSSAEGERRRGRLRERVTRLRTALGLGDAQPFSAIVPIVVGTNADALALSDTLLERGFHVQAIRPPTVPSGTARLRITLSSEHEIEHVDALATALLEAIAARNLKSKVLAS
jgi:7-keto-8-aminopelargonate synthetase-like enzyme